MSACLRCGKRVTHCRRVSRVHYHPRLSDRFYGPRNDRRWYVGCSHFELGKGGSDPSEVLRDDVRNDGLRPWPGWTCPSLAPAARD
jgi:hypothetical protein